ncbi:uncharacterized protein [Rutidosis leptorrhynchoides]|uniref:uncharacterized protein n=1 Tax=Rutidosis leptorrhynchoides TaxID=125765 RepID=UPI003A99DE5A
MGAHGLCNVRHRSSTWLGICDIGRNIEALGISFSNSFIKTISLGNDTAFWNDQWFSNKPFCEKYNRLFRLESIKEMTIDKRLIKEDGCNWSGSWLWNRTPTGRTLDELNSLLSELQAFKFANNQNDSWKWNLSNNGIDLDTLRCQVCDEGLETVKHTLHQCKFAQEVWTRVLKWWGVSSQTIPSLEDLLEGKSDPARQDRPSLLWQAITWSSIYLIWKYRNHAIFRKKKGLGPMALNEIQIKSYQWISNRSSKIALDWNQWLLNTKSFDDHG